MNITLQGLTKIFPGRGRKNSNPVTAVDHFSCEIPDGELVALLGPSGCGKSTMLNLICGLETPTEGSILFGREEVTHLAPELRGVGMVFQNYARYPHLPVRQNIRFPLENLKGKKRPSRQEMLRRAMDSARLVQIEDLMDRKPKELSGGQQQRVAIARALVKMPDVLLLDEPLSNLDARLRLQTREEIRRIQKKTGITTIFVTHDQDEAMSLADRVAVMRQGVLMQMGRPQEVYDDPASLFVAQFLGTPPINVFEGVIRQGILSVGGQELFPVTGCEDQEVWMAVRPEGLLPQEDGPFACELERVEVMGRDTSIVCRHKACTGSHVRAIVSAENCAQGLSRTVRFALKPHKVFLFHKERQSRLRFEMP